MSQVSCDYTSDSTRSRTGGFRSSRRGGPGSRSGLRVPRLVARSASRTAASIPSLPTSCRNALTSGRTAATPSRPGADRLAPAPRSRAPMRPADSGLDPVGEQDPGGARRVPAAEGRSGLSELRVVAAQRPDPPDHAGDQRAIAVVLASDDERRRAEQLVEGHVGGQAGDAPPHEPAEQAGVGQPDARGPRPQAVGMPRCSRAGGRPGSRGRGASRRALASPRRKPGTSAPGHRLVLAGRQCRTLLFTGRR